MVIIIVQDTLPGFPHTPFRPVDERFPLFWLAQKPPHLLRRFRRVEKVFSLPAALRLPPSAQPVSVCFAPENRGRNVSKKSFLPAEQVFRTS